MKGHGFNFYCVYKSLTVKKKMRKKGTNVALYPVENRLLKWFKIKMDSIQHRNNARWTGQFQARKLFEPRVYIIYYDKK